ncbi:MAG: glycosyltransferase family 4 protein [Candidatus Scalindua sp.]|jgi:glycosyltransferase involved in cell wall biosynthesis|nr:glycosyltransferase family 4 protein [Candidatus Scalindua sp.]MBT6227192.1 glycosyltransferase family 4 protein [Candidatus Scalindua sp.]MBT6563127.1 glycosyltransferase family 4 protein [Candidatus Scalindua sp.]MBT7213283.1 glycosyltransferase family 4 protein [Candidatus Scalindua sp.]MBT7591054.1 glycosyltransferase family 4 protein [Candidatus Scalindua sp.]
MIYLILPRGNNFGWGVCGKYLVKEISNITDTKYITENFGVEDIGDEYEFHFLKSKLISETEATNINSGESRQVEGPVLQAISNHSLVPWGPEINGSFKAGYTFFEENILKQEYIQNGKDNFDVVITGSKWCEEVLRNHGLDNVTTVIQGVDQQIFNSHHSEKEIFKDKFVIFSGGKFEIRKGQDIVIKAYKILQDRHKDVMLVNSWYNMWGESMNTMAASQHIKYQVNSKDYSTIINTILHDNGLDTNRIVTMLPRPNAMMSKIYKNTDIGLFPNRCEGGTNLVLMEFMACGKPVIASYNSGHRDVINNDNSIMIENMKQIDINKNGTRIATWDDPDLDETVSHLEWAYQNRDKLKSHGLCAANDLKELTWKKSAEKFIAIINGHKSKEQSKS